MNNNYIDQAQQVFMNTYSKNPIVMDRGEGVYLYDITGKKYLDFAAGIAVFALGYGNEDYNRALKAQVDKLIHTSNLYYNTPSIEAGAKLCRVSGMDKVFFTNSGTESIEGAIKLARKYAYLKNPSGNSEIISMLHSFHGRSIGALSVTGQPKYQEAFKPLLPGVKFAEFNNLESVKEKINDNTCAIILEPIQGEGGLYPATKEFLQGVRDLCDEHDMVLIFDEIQCGMGRTGTMFAYEGFGVKPDILTSAKALGCGVPVGAILAVDKVASAFEPGDHGTTYGSNPLVTASVSKVLDIFEDKDLLSHVKKVSSYLEKKLDELVLQFPNIVERRGVGLMQGLEFSCAAKDYLKKAHDLGLILIGAGPNIIRFVPPLIITEQNVDDMLDILKQCITE